MRAAAAPYAYDDYKKQKVAKKLAEKQESRIRRAEALPSVNAELAQRLLSPPEEDKPRKRGKKKSKQGLPVPTEANPLGDDRFGAMFTDERFQVDESTEEWKLRHPPVKNRSSMCHISFYELSPVAAALGRPRFVAGEVLLQKVPARRRLRRVHLLIGGLVSQAYLRI